MKIRRKLLLLLLVTTVTPLVAISAFRQITLRLARQRLTGKIQATLVSDAGLQLQQLLESYDEILVREVQIMDALVRRQAREVEFRLSQAPANHVADNELAGQRPDVPRSTVAGTGGGESDGIQAQDHHELPVDYRRQTVFLPEGVQENAVAADLDRLLDMTAAYREIHRLGPAGILWQYTSLENGLHMTYPGTKGQTHPPNYDPRKRPWYLQAKIADTVVRVGPIVDAVTGKMTITVATPLHRDEGSFAGVTAIDRTIPDILAEMRLPQRWAAGTERMLVAIDPHSDPCEPKVIVVMQSRNADAGGDWQQQVQLEVLQSPEASQFRMMTDDLQAGRPGIRKMEYQGRSCLWVYGTPRVERIIPLLIVPYDAVIELATATSQTLLRESAVWLWGAGIVLLVVVAATALIAVARARSVTQPISDLAQAGTRLAEGDYSAHVHITTGDELAQLGAVFNEVGPKLNEREKLKKSLELAGAIQQGLLPKQAPSLKHFDLAGQCLYCDETGGDYYDFIDTADLGPGKVGIAIGDVTGHGIGAALLMTAARSSLRANTRQHGTDLVKLFDKTNRDLVRDTGDDKFLTLFYGIVDDRDRSLTWVSGGHDPALWLHADRGTIEELPNTGMLMGMFEEATFEQAGPIHLESDDVVVVGTDGIWEARDAGGNLFGKERLCEILRTAHGSAEEICRTVLKAVEDFVGSAPRQDDVTLVVLKTLRSFSRLPRRSFDAESSPGNHPVPDRPERPPTSAAPE